MTAAEQLLFQRKIKTSSELHELLGPPPRKDKVIMCHGTFDLVHPGHIRHLIYAKSKAPILIASLTSDIHINKGNHRPFVPQALRAMTLGAGGWLGVALASVPDVARYGAVRMDGHKVASFEEKGRSGPGLINGGVYYATSSVLERMPSKESFSFENELLRPMTEAGQVVGYCRTQEFIDIGIPEDYHKAQAQFA